MFCSVLSLSLSLSLSLYIYIYTLLCFTLCIIHLSRGMESLIKSQKETITELEAKIQANMAELKKVDNNMLNYQQCTFIHISNFLEPCR